MLLVASAGSAQDILDFVGGYGATFPMFEKIDVNGPNTHPLYKYLKEQKGELVRPSSPLCAP